MNILNMLYTLRFFSSKCSLFHNVKLFGTCIIHILYKGCAKIKKNNSGSKELRKRVAPIISRIPFLSPADFYSTYLKNIASRSSGVIALL